MKIHVKNTAGKKQEYNVEDTDTIESIKHKIAEKEGLSTDQQRIILRGKQLVDTDTVASAKIVAGETLSLVVQMR